MKKNLKHIDRRNFIKKSTNYTLVTGSLFAFPLPSFSNPVQTDNVDNINVIGPKKGFTPQIGTLVSMMNWMRNVVVSQTRGLSIKDLDYIHDDDANSIGAMLLHLAATERFYQIHTFENKRWGDWSEKDREDWIVASGLGDAARTRINGNELSYYLDKLQSVRSDTLAEFAKRDDDWLMSVDQNWGWGPTNNYCKWFHVCEHESNHNGQIKWLKSRINKL